MSNSTLLNKCFSLITGYLLFPGIEVDLELIREYFFRNEVVNHLVCFLKEITKGR
jgi:hypothetical protein